MDEIEADALIVGSGFAGALLADRLADMGVGCTVLEAGARVDRSTAFQSFLNAVVKTPESPYERLPDADFPISQDSGHWYRQAGPDTFKSTYLKAVGGTSWHWLGTCVRFLPSDFRMRTLFGQAEDWPIGYDELEPFYTEAERELGVAGDSAEDLGSPRSGPFPMPPVPRTYLDRVYEQALAGTSLQVKVTPQARNSVNREGRPACCGSATCIPICPVAAKYDATVHLERASSKGAVLHERTTATRIETDADGQVSALRFRRPDGSGGLARGRVYILAANAIETARLLLHSSSERLPGGIANESDQVGRNLMDHPVQLSWAVAGEPVWPYRGPLSTSGIENLRDGSFRRQRSSLRIQISNDGWNWPTGGAMTLADMLWRRGLRGVALRQAIADHASRQVQLAALTEQLPEPENRVALDARDRDLHGVPLPRVHYRVGEYSRRGLAAARRVHDEIFARLRATELHHADDFQGAGHIIGTTRMGDDPSRSVVDRDLRCHGHPNLFLVGAGAFPTASTANPTLTIAALALRAAAAVAETLSATPTPFRDA
ncbi:MAG: GMC family oxidoreductase [Gemmatimonadota bacterium]|nr:GMC family oxidoreductase [Gemmatimonadota bacterium]